LSIDFLIKKLENVIYMLIKANMLSFLRRCGIFIVICLLCANTYSCSGGGGGGGGGGLSTSGGSSNGLLIETINATAEIGGPYDMPYEINAETDPFLYIATPYALLQVEKTTGKVKTLAGYTRDFTTGDYFISSPSNLNLFGSNLYAGDQLGKIFGVFIGDDNYGTVELLFNGHLPGTNNDHQIFGNSTRMFYTVDTGLNWMAYGDYKTPHFLTSYPAGNNQIIVTDNEIFFGTYSTDRSISRYDLNTGTMNVIRTGIQSNVFNPPPMTWHAPYLYWADGNAIDRYDTGTSQIQRIASNVADYIQSLAADNNSIYATVGYGYSPTIFKVDILSAQVTTLWNSIVTTLTTENGNAYFLGYVYGPDDIIYQISGNNPPSQFLTAADLNSSSISGLTSGSGMLFLTTGNTYDGKIATYELSTGIKNIFYPVFYPDSYFYHDQSIISYTYAGSGQLTKIPLDKPLRPIVEVSPKRTSAGSVGSMVRDGNYFYWIWKSSTAQDFRVSRVSLDTPGPAEDLFQSSSELRDIFIYNGLVYFSCLDNCGSPGWILTSLPLNGGAITPVFGLGGDPRTFYLNSVFYLATTLDFQTRTLYTISLVDGSYSKLLAGLYYDQYPTDIILKASSKWLYIGQGYLPLSGGFTYKISRYQIIDWKSIGPEQTISFESDSPVQSLMPTSISTDGKYLYYWDGALKRVAE
jgi:hypothetical protein